MIYIYQIYCNDNQKIYVGQTNNLTQRLSRHKTLLKQRKHFNRHLQNCYDLYGKDSLKYEVINQVNTRAESSEQELSWINTYKQSGLSLNQTTEIGLYERSAEARAKISKAHKGRFIAWKDKIRETILNDDASMERIRLIGKSNKGRKYPNRKVSAHNRSWSNDHRLNSSRANGFVPFYVLSPNNEIYYVEMLKPFCREHNLDQSSLRKVRNGVHRHHKGWKYYEL